MRLIRIHFLVICFLLASQSSFAQDVFECARTGNLEQLKTIIKINPDTISVRNAAGFTPLIIACYKHELEIVRFLLDNKVDVDANSPEGPALLGACYKGDVEMAELLIRYKANVNAVNAQGISGLMYAAMTKNVKLVMLLLNKGANKELAEKSGKKAIDYAHMSKSEEIVSLLK
jgi:hypothetical protein